MTVELDDGHGARAGARMADGDDEDGVGSDSPGGFAFTEPWLPRERLLLLGRSALSDAEVLALVLGGGHALALAGALLERFGGVAGLDRAAAHELLDVPGVGTARATAICGACELARRIALQRLVSQPRLRGPEDVARFAQARWGAAEQEVFAVVGLDARQRLLLVREAAIGSLADVDVHPREVFRPLLRAGAHAAIVVHNHPSGEAEPSRADIELTLRLVEVGHLLGIPLLDHVIVTRTDSVSLAVRGVIEAGA